MSNSASTAPVSPTTATDELDARIDDVLDRIGAFISFWFRCALIAALCWTVIWLLFLSPTAALIADAVFVTLQLLLLATVAVTVLTLEIAAVLWLANGARISWVMPKQATADLDDFTSQPAIHQQAGLLAALLKGLVNLKPVSGDVRRGMLIAGPSGSGKTHLALAIAAAAGIPLAYASVPSLCQGLSVISGLRIRLLYAKARRLARKHGSCIVFLEDIDAVGDALGRSSGLAEAIVVAITPPVIDLGWRARLARAMGFRPGPPALDSVFTIAATAAPELSPRALLQPGRLDWRWILAPPDSIERETLIRACLEQVPHDPAIATEPLAVATAGRTAGEIRRLINEAVLIAAGEGRPSIEQFDLERALEDRDER